jgi:hypothetical protein
MVATKESLMITFLLVLLAAAAVYYIVTAVLAVASDYPTWQLERLAVRVGLGVPADLDERVPAQMRRRTVNRSVGGLIGLLIGVAAGAVAVRLGLVTPSDSDDSFPLVVLVTLIAAFSELGVVLGLARAALRSETPRPGEVRVARPVAVTVGDYVPTALRAGVLVLLVLAAATTTILVVTTGAAAWVVPGVALVIVGVVGQVAFAIVSRRIVARGRSTSSTDELVWDDALRSETLREFLYLPVYFVVLGTWYTLLAPGGAVAAPLAFLPAGSALALVVVVNLLYRSTRTRYLHELWPGSRRRTPDEEAARLAAARSRQEAHAR